MKARCLCFCEALSAERRRSGDRNNSLDMLDDEFRVAPPAAVLPVRALADAGLPRLRDAGFLLAVRALHVGRQVDDNRRQQLFVGRTRRQEADDEPSPSAGSADLLGGENRATKSVFAEPALATGRVRN